MALVIRLYFDIRSHLPYTIFDVTDEFQDNNNNTENLMIKSTDFEFSLLLKRKLCGRLNASKVLYHAYVVYVTIYSNVTFCFDSFLYITNMTAIGRLFDLYWSFKGYIVIC